MPIPRYVPNRPLPPYSYVPGMFPHPISHPTGHMHGMKDEEGAHQENDLPFGFDLFNHGFYWEAHEAWEQAWVAAGRRGMFADVLKGLIKLAAAGVKAREGKPEGIRRHARRAGELFSSVASCDEHDLSENWARSCRQWEGYANDVNSQADQLVNNSPEHAVVVFSFVLECPTA